MKTLKYLFFTLVILTGISSCSDSLDLAPEDYFGSGNFWQNEAQVNNFMVGIHKQMRDNQFMFVRLKIKTSGKEDLSVFFLIAFLLGFLFDGIYLFRK